MYVHRIILHDVLNFKHLDITLEDDWQKQPLKSVLFTGPNGSGKTTLLRVIAALWQGLVPQSGREFTGFSGSNFAAIEIHDLVDAPILLCRGREYFEKEHLKNSNIDENYSINFSRNIYLSDERLPISLQELNRKRQRLLVGANEELIPNMLFLEAENRSVPNSDVAKASANNAESYIESFYKWVVTYDGNDRQNNLEIMLRNHRVRDPQNFDQLINQINSFLSVKELLPIDSSNRLIVKVDGTTHPISELSSGEKQCLIMMFMVRRWLMPGGIVLIDEPDLHLHVSLQRHFIHELEKIVLEKGGQMIVTSHSPTLWEEYDSSQKILLKLEEHDRVG